MVSLLHLALNCITFTVGNTFSVVITFSGDTDAIDGKKWVRFVAMQQNSATLIYDLDTMKGTLESYLKEIAQPFKTVHFQAWKIAASS